jgi:hypothetical protein
MVRRIAIRIARQYAVRCAEPLQRGKPILTREFAFAGERSDDYTSLARRLARSVLRERSRTATGSRVRPAARVAR